MREFCDARTKKHNLNFSLLASPAEGLAGRFTRMDRKEFGEIKGVTDRDFYTNSFHVPVYYPISAFDKIDIEEYFNLDWILRATGRIPYAKIAPKIIMFKTGKTNIKESTSRTTISNTGIVICSLMSIPTISP